jgi:hypothetical protein
MNTPIEEQLRLAVDLLQRIVGDGQGLNKFLCNQTSDLMVLTDDVKEDVSFLKEIDSH